MHLVNDRRLEVVLGLQRGEIQPSEAYARMTDDTQLWHPWARAYAESLGHQLSQYHASKPQVAAPGISLANVTVDSDPGKIDDPGASSEAVPYSSDGWETL